MPSTVNGCGTWYYGKRNLQQYQGECRACKRTTTLTSYDPTLWVVVVMIPIIPLGKKRIVEQCSSCTRHVAMPLKDYEMAAGRVTALGAEYRKNPTDPKAAKEAV